MAKTGILHLVVKAQGCIQRASQSDNSKWFQQQAEILQDRADYIRQAWANEQATQLASQLQSLADILF